MKGFLVTDVTHLIQITSLKIEKAKLCDGVLDPKFKFKGQPSARPTFLSGK